MWLFNICNIKVCSLQQDTPLRHVYMIYLHVQGVEELIDRADSMILSVMTGQLDTM